MGKSSKKQKVLIIGGGISGASLAYLLQDNPKFEITLIEKADSWRTWGYALGLWKNGIDVLKKIGLYEDISGNMHSFYKGRAMNLKGEDIFCMHYDKIDDECVRAVGREELHTLFHSRIKENVKVLFGESVASFEQKNSQVHITFSSGTKEMYDLVVGADGCHSRTRKQLFGEHLEAQVYGYDSFVMKVENALPMFDGYLGAAGKDRVMFGMPYHDKFIISFSTRKGMQGGLSENCDPAEVVARYFGDFHPDLADVIANATDTKYFPDIYKVRIKQRYKGRVVLTGDAQHAAGPVSGFGTSLCLEDSYILAQELAGHDIDAALIRFSKRRKRYIRRVRMFQDFLDYFVIEKNRFRGFYRDHFLPLVPEKVYRFFFSKVFHLGESKFF